MFHRVPKRHKQSNLVIVNSAYAVSSGNVFCVASPGSVRCQLVLNGEWGQRSKNYQPQTGLMTFPDQLKSSKRGLQSLKSSDQMSAVSRLKEGMMNEDDLDPF